MSDDYGMQIRNDNDTVIWDSRNSGGGVIADIITLPTNSSVITKTYPQFAGRSIRLIPIEYFIGLGAYGDVDTNLGYPRFVSKPNTQSNMTVIINVY